MRKERLYEFNMTDKKHFKFFEIMNLTKDDMQHSKFTKKKKIEPFDFYNKKQWDELLKANSNDECIVNVVGNICLNQKKYKEINEEYTCRKKMDDGCFGVVELPLTEKYVSKHNLDYEFKKFDVKNAEITSNKLLTKTVGYIKVNENEYLRMTQRSLLPLIFLIIAFLTLVIGLIFGGMNYKNEIPNIDEVNGNAISSSENVDDQNTMAENHYLYLFDKKVVTEDKKTVALVNHPENDVYLCYEIYDENNNLLDSTGSFKPNTQIDYDFYSLFNGEKGKYDLTLLIKVNDLETKEPLCSKTMPVVIYIQ